MPADGRESDSTLSIDARGNISPVDEQRQEPLARGLRLALDFFEAGEDMMRMTIRRRLPHADQATVERTLDEWLRFRPGAENGDSAGRPVPWPRS